MRQRGQWRPDHELLTIANALMKFAGREYLKTRNGQPGAIEDFKTLVRKNFLADKCVDYIALCHLDMGDDLYQKEKYDEAQRAWDEGLRWARKPLLRRALWTNKAGAYEMDRQHELAEAVLHQQIAAEPDQPGYHKNLGLVLGYRNRLKEALFHYEKARELCGGPTGPLALLNGNAWLRAAVIHGTLLEHEGDVRLAWRLFLEYRALFGDDYNFSLWFGDFAAAQGEYDLAWRYLERARDLQPRCSPAYQKLTQIAPRTKGTREEVEVRTKAAAQALFDAQARYFRADESMTVLNICGGIADLGDIGLVAERIFLEPDPLAGLDALHPPPWVEAVARSRDPFVPFDPSASPETPAGPDAQPPGRPAWALVAAGGAAVLVAAGAALFLVFRRP
jgi:tetratricopeptide (TPR) repeat protein